MPSTPDPSGAAPIAVPDAAVVRPTGRRRRGPTSARRRGPVLLALGLSAALALAPKADAGPVTYGQNPTPGPLAAAPEPSSAPLVCVADTGVRPVAALLGRLVASDTLTAIGGLLDGPSDHGTLVAESVLATWPWARIASVRVFENGGAPITVIPRAIDRCVAMGADVINLSMSSPRPEQGFVDDLRAAVQRARAANVDVVLSAGNEPGPVRYPAEAVADIATVVDATDSAGRCAFSSTGPEVLVGAQGCPTWLPATDGTGWIPFAGTSFAVPQVAAALAAVKAYAPSLGVDQRRSVLAGMPSGVLDQAELLRRIGRADLVPAGPAPAVPNASPPVSSPPTVRAPKVRVRAAVRAGRLTARVTGGAPAGARLRVRGQATTIRVSAGRATWRLPRPLRRTGTRLDVRVESRTGDRLASVSVRVPRT